MGTGYVFKNPPADFFPLSLAERESAVFQMAPQARKLKEALLGVAGDMVCWHIREAHLDLLIEKGRRFSARSAVMRIGEPSGCHGNTARLFLMGRAEAATGYAISDDRWVQHSWGIADGKTVVETTARRKAYFGVVLPEADAFHFALSNIEGPSDFERIFKKSGKRNGARLQRLLASITSKSEDARP
jgi:hypothetical protein